MAEAYGRKAHFFALDQLATIPPPRWLIEDLFEINSLIMLAGPPGSYKSLLALDWMMCMASGRKWNGHKVQQAKVLYVLGEGKASIYKRILSWLNHNTPNSEEFQAIEDNFRVGFEVPQMAVKDSVDTMLANLAAENFLPGVIVIDTFARSFVGYDENSNKDAGVWVESADRLRQLGYTVIFLHHTRKNTESGVHYRGASAILGAMDTAFTMVRDRTNVAMLTCTKQKDHDEPEAMCFLPRKLTINWQGVTEEGCALVQTVQVDERFSEQHLWEEKIVDGLLKDLSFESDRSRARALCSIIGLDNFETARTKIARRKKELSGGGSLPGSAEIFEPGLSLVESTG